jgi:hypothetical protein
MQQANPMETPIMQMQGFKGTVELKANETPAFIAITCKHLIVSCRKKLQKHV